MCDIRIYVLPLLHNLNTGHFYSVPRYYYEQFFLYLPSPDEKIHHNHFLPVHSPSTVPVCSARFLDQGKPDRTTATSHDNFFDFIPFTFHLHSILYCIQYRFMLTICIMAHIKLIFWYQLC